jgi:hypothetical protein
MNYLSIFFFLISLSSFAQTKNIDCSFPTGNEISMNGTLIETTSDSTIYQFSVINNSQDTIDIIYTPVTMYGMTPDSIYYSLGPTHSGTHFLLYPGQDKVFWEDFSIFKNYPIINGPGNYLLYWNLIFINKGSNVYKCKTIGPLALWNIE